MTQIDTRLQELGVTTTVNCYFRPGAIEVSPYPLIGKQPLVLRPLLTSCTGNGWALAKSQSDVVSQGRRVEVTVCSEMFVVIPAGQTFAFAVSPQTLTGLAYRDGLGNLTVVSNNDVDL